VETEALTDEDRRAQLEDKLNSFKADLPKVRQRLSELEAEVELLVQQQSQEIETISVQATGTKAELRTQLKATRDAHKAAMRELKDAQKLQQKTLKDDIKRLEVAISETEYELKLLNNRGKLELILADSELVGILKERWIAAEVAKRLDYPIFMAVSERSGKNNSGEYEYVVDRETGGLIEFPEGHPQEGQLVVDQDLVNYDLTMGDLAAADAIPEDQLRIAESFVKFAQEQSFDFWEAE
jgi:type I restriction enzyme M protein